MLKSGIRSTVDLTLKVIRTIYLLRLLSLLAAMGMPLQPELNDKARRQVSSMWLNLKRLQRKPEPTGR